MIDVSFLTNPRPVQIETPAEAQAVVQQAQNLRNLGQLQQQGLQQGALDIQQKQIQMRQAQVLNDAYRQAYTPASAQTPASGSGAASLGATGQSSSIPAPAASGGSAPGIDANKLASALALGGAGSAIPSVLKGVTEFQKSVTDLATAKTDLAAKQADAAGGLGATLKQANYDPRLFLTLGTHARQAGAVDPNLINPLLGEVNQALQQDPSGAQATALTKQLADHFIAGSPAQQKLINEGLTAQGAANRGNAALTDANLKVKNDKLSDVAKQLSAPGMTPVQYAQAYGVASADPVVQQNPDILARFDKPENFDPQATTQRNTRAALTPEQTMQADQKAQELAKLNTPAELAFKAAQGDPDAKGALKLIEQQSIRERQASNPSVTVQLTPGGQAIYDRALQTTGQPIAIPRGPGGQQVISALNRIGANDPTINLGSTKADYKADSGSLAGLQKQRDAVGAFEQTASANLNLFLSAASKIPDSGVPWVNTPLRMLTSNVVGSENMAAVNAARQVANNEIAKVTSNPTLAGTLSDSARHEVEAYNPQNATFKQTLAVANILRQDMANRRVALDQGIAQIKGRISGNPNTAGAPDNSDVQSLRKKYNY